MALMTKSLELDYVYIINSIFKASEDNTVLQNMLGTFKEYHFPVRVCTLSTDAHPHEVFWTYVSISAVQRIVSQILPITPFGGPNMLGTFFPN